MATNNLPEGEVNVVVGTVIVSYIMLHISD